MTNPTLVPPRLTAMRASAGSTAASWPLEALNSAVINWFDSVRNFLSALPNNPFSELLQGGLILVRRTFFNQDPTANPYEYLARATGQLVGTVNAVDPEGDSLTYRVTEAPKFGTVQVAADGTYTYTPGAGYTGNDSFNVAVSDNRLNVLAPALGAAPTATTVHVGQVLPGEERYADHVTIANSTGKTVKVVDLMKEPGYEDYVEVAPPVGTILNPGDSVYLKLRIAGGDVFPVYVYDTRVRFESCNTTDCTITSDSVPWIARLRVTLGDDSSGLCESGQCTVYYIHPTRPDGNATLTLLPPL